MVMLNIKLNVITNAARRTICLQNPTPSAGGGDGVKWSKFNFLQNGHNAYQIKENQICSNMVAIILPTAPSPPALEVGTKGQNSTFLENGHVVYQL